MEYTTHNQQQIDTDALSDTTVIKATVEELTALFGAGIEGRPMWRVLFKDENVAFIYPCTDDAYYVESRSKQGLVNVQIALDLHREQITEQQNKEDPVHEALGSAIEIMESIRATRGVPYARVVEVALLIRKQSELLNAMVGAAVEGGKVGATEAELIGSINARMSAQIVSLSARLGGLDPDKDGPVELIEWTDRIMEAEQDAARKLVKMKTGGQ